VLQSDRAVRGDEHRPTFRLVVAVRHGHRGFLVHARDHLRRLVAAVVDDRFVQSAEARSRIGGNVLEAERLQHVEHEVRSAALVLADDLHVAGADGFAGGGHDRSNALGWRGRRSWRSERGGSRLRFHRAGRRYNRCRASQRALLQEFAALQPLLL
jgi:hypothetical protein